MLGGYVCTYNKKIDITSHKKKCNIIMIPYTYISMYPSVAFQSWGWWVKLTYIHVHVSAFIIYNFLLI